MPVASGMARLERQSSKLGLAGLDLDDQCITLAGTRLRDNRHAVDCAWSDVEVPGARSQARGGNNNSLVKGYVVRKEWGVDIYEGMGLV